MSSATTIRHCTTKRGFILVTAIYGNDSKSVVQIYDTLKDNSTILISEYVYSTETRAIERFNEIVNLWK